MEDNKFSIKNVRLAGNSVFDRFYVLEAFNMFSSMFSYLFYCVPFYYIGQVTILVKSQIGPVSTIDS